MSQTREDSPSSRIVSPSSRIDSPVFRRDKIYMLFVCTRELRSMGIILPTARISSMESGTSSMTAKSKRFPNKS